MKIVFTGGGTCGHIFPIIAIIREIKKISSKELGKEFLFLYYLGPRDKCVNFLKKEGVKIKIIFSGKIRRYFTPLAFLQNLIDLFLKIPLGTLQAFIFLFLKAPDIIFSKGGYGSLPVVFAGWLLRIPILLHESDTVAGLVNKLLGKFALEIFVSFPKTEGFPQDKILVIGNPIREEILRGSSQEAKRIFNLTGEKPIILIMGGSQGAVRINETILDILPEWVKHFELIHLTGTKNFKEIEREAKILLSPEAQKYYHPVGFLEEDLLKHAYQVCHLIISRAGAGSIFEIACLGKPSILIPLPEAAQNHQTKNAYAFAETGGTIVIEHANLKPHFLLKKICYLFAHPDKLQEMAKKAREFGKPRAGKIIGKYILTYLKRS